ncbi:MAG: hypothetical protein ACUVRD_03380 [Bacteroidia bacterium]
MATNERTAEIQREIFQLLENERQKLEKVRSYLKDEGGMLSAEETRELRRTVEDLWVSLQFQMRSARRSEIQLQKLNHELAQKKQELENTLNALIETQRRRRAVTILGISAIGFFIVTELLEYWIESSFSQYGAWANGISITLKALIALSFKPLEEIVEGFLAKSVRLHKTN